jgi:hypothetical protein
MRTAKRVLVMTFDEFYELAILSDDDLRALWSPVKIDMLQVFVHENLRDVELPELTTPNLFVEAIRIISSNKKLWANRLSGLLIEQASPDRDIFASEKNFREFIESCPWKHLREAAEAASGKCE